MSDKKDRVLAAKLWQRVIKDSASRCRDCANAEEHALHMWATIYMTQAPEFPPSIQGEAMEHLAGVFHNGIQRGLVRKDQQKYADPKLVPLSDELRDKLAAHLAMERLEVHLKEDADGVPQG